MNGQSALELSDAGYALLEQGRYPEALGKLNQAQLMSPDSAQISYRIGLVYLDSSRLAEALIAFDRALVLEPGNARAHNNRGSCLEMGGHTVAAEAAYRCALDLDAQLPGPYINLGHLLETQNKQSESMALYRTAIGLGLDSAVFGHHLAALSGAPTGRAPANWVRDTFDSFAPGFDAHLHTLGYNVPEKLAALLLAHTRAPLDILDLGCGTGLAGLALAAEKRSLTGVDLSAKMLVRARERGVYDALFESEIHTWLQQAQAASCDVVVAADVFIYIGSLEEIFVEAARVLRPGGWFAFSTEECKEAPYALLPTGRYAQSQAYIRGLAADAFSVEAAQAAILRIETGRLYLLRKSAQI